MRLREIFRRFLTREVLTFLAVGGTGYVVDVTAFNVLRSLSLLATLDPLARAHSPSSSLCASPIPATARSRGVTKSAQTNDTKS